MGRLTSPEATKRVLIISSVCTIVSVVLPARLGNFINLCIYLNIVLCMCVLLGWWDPGGTISVYRAQMYSGGMISLDAARVPRVEKISIFSRRKCEKSRTSNAKPSEIATKIRPRVHRSLPRTRMRNSAVVNSRRVGHNDPEILLKRTLLKNLGTIREQPTIVEEQSEHACLEFRYPYTSIGPTPGNDTVSDPTHINKNQIFCKDTSFGGTSGEIHIPVKQIDSLTDPEMTSNIVPQSKKLLNEVESEEYVLEDHEVDSGSSIIIHSTSPDKLVHPVTETIYNDEDITSSLMDVELVSILGTNTSVGYQIESEASNRHVSDRSWTGENMSDTHSSVDQATIDPSTLTRDTTSVSPGDFRDSLGGDLKSISYGNSSNPSMAMCFENPETRSFIPENISACLSPFYGEPRFAHHTQVVENGASFIHIGSVSPLREKTGNISHYISDVSNISEYVPQYSFSSQYYQHESPLGSARWPNMNNNFGMADPAFEYSRDATITYARDPKARLNFQNIQAPIGNNYSSGMVYDTSRIPVSQTPTTPISSYQSYALEMAHATAYTVDPVHGHHSPFRECYPSPAYIQYPVRFPRDNRRIYHDGSHGLVNPSNLGYYGPDHNSNYIEISPHSSVIHDPVESANQFIQKEPVNAYMNSDTSWDTMYSVSGSVSYSTDSREDQFV